MQINSFKLVVLRVVILLHITLCFSIAQEKGDRTVTRVEEGKQKKKIITEIFRDGKIFKSETEEIRTGPVSLVAKYSRFYQDGKQVMSEYWDSVSKEKIRFFGEKGKIVFTELDRDGDGIFEWLEIYTPSGETHSVFKREKDGKLNLISGDELSRFKKGSNIARDLFE
jgi:hypothetical protein